MSAIEPPVERVWWKQPIEPIEITWIVVAFVWCLFMFVMMPYWHVYGKQNLANEAYRSTPELFTAKAQAMDRFDPGEGWVAVDDDALLGDARAAGQPSPR